MDKSKKKSVVFTVTDIILTLIYIPASFAGLLMPMATEALTEQSPPLLVIWTYFYAYVGFFTFAFCIASMCLSFFLRKKGRTTSAYIVKFIPVFIFITLIIIDLF